MQQVDKVESDYYEEPKPNILDRSLLYKAIKLLANLVFALGRSIVATTNLLHWTSSNQRTSPYFMDEHEAYDGVDFLSAQRRLLVVCLASQHPSHSFVIHLILAHEVTLRVFSHLDAKVITPIITIASSVIDK